MAKLTRAEALELYKEEVVYQAESLEQGNFNINLQLCNVINDAYNGNWSNAIERFRKLNVLRVEFNSFVDALEENGDNESLNTLASIGFYARKVIND